VGPELKFQNKKNNRKPKKPKQKTVTACSSPIHEHQHKPAGCPHVNGKSTNEKPDIYRDYMDLIVLIIKKYGNRI